MILLLQFCVPSLISSSVWEISENALSAGSFAGTDLENPIDDTEGDASKPELEGPFSYSF
jgi:hypothetical protein